MPLTHDKKEKNLVVKVTQRDFEEIRTKANKYTKGNVSDWVRYAVKLEPRKEDLANEIADKMQDEGQPTA